MFLLTVWIFKNQNNMNSDLCKSTKKYIDISWDIAEKYPFVYEYNLTTNVVLFFVKWYCLIKY